jgi:putative tryptophan/tyrosine transport system substrate-binding protein
MRRREFITLLGSAVVTRPLAARAQQGPMPVLGFLGSASAKGYASTVAAVQKGLNEAGYFEGRNLSVEYRWADFQYDRLPLLAAELVQRRVAVIFTTGSVISAIAAKSATGSIPIVFANGSDPVQFGLVASLNRPGSNVTGISFINSELGPKRIELLREVVPKAAIIAILVNPNNPNAIPDAKAYEAAGRNIGLQIIIVNAGAEPEIKNAFAQAVQQRADALLVNVDALFNDRIRRIVALGAEYSLPTMAANHDFPTVGGLISYGADVAELNRQAGIYVARILKGERPADLPVVQPTRFALRDNLRTAKALGLTISEAFLLRADEVIE